MLMMELEQPEGISARKLVVETAKHNVITAYNVRDGLELLRRFPQVDMVLVHGVILEQNPALIGQIRELAPETPIVVASLDPDARYDGVNHVVDSRFPHELLLFLENEFHVSISSE